MPPIKEENNPAASAPAAPAIGIASKPKSPVAPFSVLAIAAATPAATLADYQQELDYGAAQGMMAAMPDDYDGDYMIEVDEPSIDDRFESTRRSYDWARRSLSFLA